MVKKISEKEFNNVYGQGNVVVDFSATWCTPCKMMAPVLEGVSEKFSDVNFYNVDVDEAMNAASQFNITNIPAILVMKDGVKKDILVGFKPASQLESEIRNLLQ